MRVARIESQDGNGLVGQTLKAPEHHLGLHGDRDRSPLIILALEVPLQCADRALDLDHGLDHIRAAMRAGESLVATGSLELDCLLVDVVQAIHSRERRCAKIRIDVRISFDVETRAVHTDIAQDLLNVINVLVEVDRACQGDVSEVTLALLVGVLAGRTDLSRLDDAETSIEDSTWDRIGTLVGLICDDFDNRTPQDLLRRGDSKLDTNHCIWHFLLYLW